LEKENELEKERGSHANEKCLSLAVNVIRVFIKM
jgi:hypothetical protein